jgi:CRISPR-associated protein (TIGR02710 family)
VKTDQTGTQHTLLICTVGGSPEPIVQALLHWRPAAVRFVVSAQTRPAVDAVLASYATQTGGPLPPGCYELISVDDPQHLGTVVASLRPLAEAVDKWSTRGENYRVVADLTGGTKCMSAALALVARRWPCKFSYVGGDRRSKDGVGIVEAGSERIVPADNPWNALGYQAVEDVVTVFNCGGYAAATVLLQTAITSADDPAVKRELNTLKAVCDAYAAWDRFDHQMARTRFDDALKNRNDLAAIFADGQKLLQRLDQHRKRVAELADATEPTAAWVEDLLCNANRRAEEHRFDDAVARMYRGFEALAQVRLREGHGISDTEAVALSSLPDGLRAAWKGREHSDGNVKLGLQDGYRLLKELGDDLGGRFTQCGLDGERSPLVARNQSILAHGFQPVGQKVFSQLKKALSELTESNHGVGNDWRLPHPS